MINKKLFGIACLAAVFVQLAVILFSWQTSYMVGQLSHWLVFRNADFAHITLEQSKALSKKQDWIGQVMFVVYTFCLSSLPILLIRWAPFKRRLLVAASCIVVLFAVTVIAGMWMVT